MSAKSSTKVKSETLAVSVYEEDKAALRKALETVRAQGSRVSNSQLVRYAIRTADWSKFPKQY